MLCHSIYLQVVKVHLFNLGLPMNRYTFVLPSENQNAICANAVCNVIQSLKEISSIRLFLQRYTRNFEIRRQVLRVKKMTKFKKNTHLSLSLCRCTLIFPKVCACTSLSLSLSLSIYICKNGLDPDQTRMEFSNECFVNLKICACDSVVQKPMRTIKWVFSISQ